MDVSKVLSCWKHNKNLWESISFHVKKKSEKQKNYMWKQGSWTFFCKIAVETNWDVSGSKFWCVGNKIKAHSIQIFVFSSE